MPRPRRPRLKPFIQAIVLLILLLGGVEVGLRVHDSWQRDQGNPLDRTFDLTMPSWAVHHRLKPLKAQKHPHPDTGKPILWRTNSYGLRGPDVLIPKPADVYRVVCLGDESVFAGEVTEPDTFCQRLQVSLENGTRQKVEVINAGVKGYCPLLSYLQLRQTLLAFQPDLIVLNFDMTDVADDHLYRRHTRMAADGTPMGCPNAEFERTSPEEERAGLQRFLTVRWLKTQLEWLTDSRQQAEDTNDINSPQGCYAWLRDEPPDWSVYIEQAFSPIELMAEFARRINADFVVSAIPAPWQISGSASNGPGVRQRVDVPQNGVFLSSRPLELLGAYCNERDIRFHNPVPEFRSHPDADSLFLTNSRGFSETGHAFYAEQLHTFLQHRLAQSLTTRPNPHYAPETPVR
ncbi:SGNH/GDSL hydrolase family protein [Thalassoroseus pseudoceratinae]|uniref:SGNH/GDSL hydrolase family protein n=1 Tax=Thalassoroseus pseudoceratinae TaxID=2713176 RepID=UPI00142365E6|nr:SGNH/GDSL hydrolase family protein [Thalassoroseus pseudoceratinae]